MPFFCLFFVLSQNQWNFAQIGLSLYIRFVTNLMTLNTRLFPYWLAPILAISLPYAYHYQSTAIAAEAPVLAETTAIQRLTASLEKQQSIPPAPVKYIHTEGTLPHHGIYDQSVIAKHDLSRMYNAALLGTATHNTSWLDYAQHYLMAWIQTYEPSFNPIDETGFDVMIETYALIRQRLSSEEQRQAKVYFSAWAKGYIQRIESHTDHKKIWSNNWQSHRVKLITLMAVALHDKALIAKAQLLFQQQITQNIDAQSETLDFKDRHAIHYVVYDLQPLVQAAIAAQSTGKDWYHWTSSQGTSLASAIAWLAPYATGKIPHEEFAHSTVKFDIIRQQAHIHGFSGLFNPKDAGTLYWDVSRLDAQWTPTAKAIMPTPPADIALNIEPFRHAASAD